VLQNRDPRNHADYYQVTGVSAELLDVLWAYSNVIRFQQTLSRRSDLPETGAL
jgi:hypothetical protein